jgi:TIR domain
MDQRDHLFVSYATENGDLAEWLTVKLTAEGYAVWCDRVQLLGGESYPQDIDHAIKNRSFRVLHLLSRASLDKPNPVKERTLALNIGGQRKVDFLIPLNVDGLTATELNWMTADLTFVPFHRSWAEGFAQLLKKLRSVDAPRSLLDSGSALIREWYQQQDAADEVEERLTSNRLTFRSVPAVVFRLYTDGETPEWPDNWPVYGQEENIHWSFAIPAAWRDHDFGSVREVRWHDEAEVAGVRTGNVVISLLRQHVRQHCLSAGLRETDRGQLYFPPELMPNDRLPFVGASGRPSFVLCTGLRTFRSGMGETRQARYALAPRFWITRTRDDGFTMEVQIRVEVMRPEGGALDVAIAQRRRKRITKTWFNHQWRTRLVAVCRWLGDGTDAVDLGCATGVPVVISTSPVIHVVDRGIDEVALASRKGESLIDEDVVSQDDDTTVLPDADVYGEDNL